MSHRRAMDADPLRASGLVGIWRGVERIAALDPSDRGFAYGDGLFETMRAHAGTLPWWPRHRARLLAGARRLGIAIPGDPHLDAALAEALVVAPEGIIKLVLTRGTGARGYAPPSASPDARAAPTLAVFASSPISSAMSSSGGLAPALALHVDLLSMRLGVQPLLAGLKHLNRLEQVLGAREAAERGLDEGLMADGDGRIVCGTRGNILARLDGRWITPPVDRAGVAGIVRGLLLESWPALSEAVLHLDDLPRVDALFLTNAVRGILPVGRCGVRELDPRPTGLEDARAVLAASHPAFRES